MNKKHEILDPSQRKKILLLCDDITAFSGIATMGREIVLNTAHRYNWLNLGAAQKHPREGEKFDLSEQVNKQTGLTNSDVKMIANTGYGNPSQLRQLISEEKPDALLLFTDPRYWTWLFNMEREIRSKIPIFYLNIWDNIPYPYYNKPYYEACDALLAISKQTKNINEVVLGDQKNDKVISYVPHGVNKDHFYPVNTSEDTQQLETFKQEISIEDKDFVLFFNSRNLRRKAIPNTMLAYKAFCERIGERQAKKCVFILHTDPVDNAGTDLYKVTDHLINDPTVDIRFSTSKVAPNRLNQFYNVADATIQMSSNEGWGLALTESLMAGTMIIANVTGGMQDQMRFENTKEDWLDFTPKLPTNHEGKYTKCGEWAIPVFPNNRSVEGSVPTPYIMDDRCDIDDITEAIQKVYKMPKSERIKKGLRGHKWASVNLSSEKMGIRVKDALDKGFKTFKPRKQYELHKIV